jgi:hypothetical protein
LSQETRAWCDSIAGLRGRDLYKALVAKHLRRTNQPPVADLKLDRVQPDRVDLNAADSTDEDGFPNIFYFRLEDAETGEVVAGPLTTREPVATLLLNGKRPQTVRAVVVVEDDERALDEAALELNTPALCGTNGIINCYAQPNVLDITTCYPAASSFETPDVWEAASRCNSNISTSTPAVFAAGGAGGGRGADFLVDGSPGGAGGLAALGTTKEDLDQAFGSDTSYCYGVGKAGGHTDTAAGAGGASTIVRTCDSVSQSETTGVLLIAAGGGGGRTDGDGGGGVGGVAYSGTDDSCPGSCILSADPTGQSGSGGTPGSGGGSGMGGGAGTDCQAGGNGNDGVGGAGGYVKGFGTAYWYTTSDPKVAVNVGQGGEDCEAANNASAGSSPAGGGGYGGGGAGGDFEGGAGGGGSFAASSTQNNIDPSLWDRASGDGWISIYFDLPQP